jgi:hypothetical protein
LMTSSGGSRLKDDDRVGLNSLGVQTDSSVTSLARLLIWSLTCAYRWPSFVVDSPQGSASDGPGTAQSTLGRPRNGLSDHGLYCACDAVPRPNGGQCDLEPSATTMTTTAGTTSTAVDAAADSSANCSTDIHRGRRRARAHAPPAAASRVRPARPRSGLRRASVTEG